jgi:hypothetical protein
MRNRLAATASGSVRDSAANAARSAAIRSLRARRAQARDKVKRNVVLLVEDVAKEREGRPSKSLTLDQADALLAAAENAPLHAYIVVSCSLALAPRNYAR